MTRRIRTLFLATTVMFFAASTRLINLQTLPPGLARDEALNADIVSFIWQGQHALFFREGFGHEPLYHYFSAIFQPLIGDNFLAIRLPSVFLGLVFIAITYSWIKRDFGLLPAGTTLLLLTLSWYPIIFSRVGLRPISLPLLLVLSAWFWQKHPRLAGLCLGLSLYTYTAARAIYLIPLTYFIYLIYLKRKRTPNPQSPTPTLHIFLLTLLIYLPLFLTLRADPTLQERVGQLNYLVESLREGNWLPLWQGLVSTLGVFTFRGDPLWSYGLPNTPLFDWFTGIFFYLGLFVAFIRARHTPRYAFILIWLLITLIPSVVTPDAPSTIRLIGTLPIVYLLPALGLQWLITNYQLLITKENYPLPTTHYSLLTILLLTLTALTTTRTYQNGFTTWANAPDVRQKYQSVWLEMSDYWRDNPAGTLIISDSWYEPIKATSLRRDYGHPLPDRWVQQSNALIYPATGTTLLLIPEFAPLHPALTDLAQLHTPHYRSTTHPSFAAYQLSHPPPGNLSAIHHFTPPALPPALQLQGIEFLNRNPLELLTHWRVLTPLPPDATIFIHLLDQTGQAVSQFDGFDAIPETLRPGDTLIHHHTLPIPDPNTPHTLQLGLYSRQTGQRWIHTPDQTDHLILDPAYQP